MASDYTDHELEQLIRDANERAHNGRLKRLRIVLSAEDPSPAPVSALAYEFYEEARLCWYAGAFVGAIVMTQMAFEEMLRSHFRVSKRVGGRLYEAKKVDDMGFAELVKEAQSGGWLRPEEATALDNLRKHARNPYVHPKDFVTQLAKIKAPDSLERGAEAEAREAITLLVTKFRRISRRLWGG